MNQRQFASVLFAVLGVFIAITWLPQIVLAIGLFVQPTETPAGLQADRIYAIALFIGTLLAVLLGVALVLKRDRLAERLFVADTGPLAPRDGLAVGLAVLGCYFALSATPRLVTILRFGMTSSEWVALVELILGVALFFGARGVARFLGGRTLGGFVSF